mmetsp:Transcript_23997/g.36860  ORF Transcript_23997/g.36860 Transcript_23997/m.36860 type:complete len:231 (+) Transcript_23997:2242-2934(+)
MRREEGGILVSILLVLDGNWLEPTRPNLLDREPMVSHTRHVDILVGARGGIVKEGEAPSLVAENSHSVNVEHCACNIRSSTEGPYFQRVQMLILSQFLLENFIIEITRAGHGDQDDRCSRLSPRNEIGIVLVNRQEDDGLVRVHSEVVAVLLEVQLVDFGLAVLFVSSKAREDGLTELALIGAEPVHLTEIGGANDLVDFASRHELSASFHFLHYVLNSNLVDQQVRGRS